MPEPPSLILRKATEADALEVLAWRNDPLTRAMSRTHEEVSQAAHLAWFARVLADPRAILLIGELAGEKVGMVRFDCGAETEVSINLNPAHRSRGLGYALLSQALAWAPGEVVAEIRDENLASQQLFERAGFRLRSREGGRRRYSRRPD
jgi:RimJ/RimL family protein N-acetyltransferase